MLALTLTHPQFQGLENHDLHVLHHCSKLVNFRKGEAIYNKGDAGEFFYVVCAGVVHITDPDDMRLGVIEEPLTPSWRRRIAFAFLFPQR